MVLKGPKELTLCLFVCLFVFKKFIGDDSERMWDGKAGAGATWAAPHLPAASGQSAAGAQLPVACAS